MTRPILNTIREVLTQPVHTYRSIRDVSPVESGVYFFWLLCVFALGRIALAITNVEDSYLSLGVAVAFVFILSIIIAGYCFLFFNTYIINFAASLVGGKIQNHLVFRVLVYSATPALLFGWIPVIGLVGILYTVILALIGLRELVELSLSRSVLVMVMSTIAMLFVTLVYTGVPYFINVPSLVIELGYAAWGVIFLVIVLKSLWREVIREVL